MARASRAQVIAEGIELPEELAVLSEMGVDLVQGYLFGRPQEHPASDVQQMLPSADAPASLPATRHGDLRALLLEQRAVDVRTSTQEVVEIFRRQANPELPGDPLDEEGRPIGIVHRHALTDALLRPASPATCSCAKPISRLMSDDFLAVELGQTLQRSAAC